MTGLLAPKRGPVTNLLPQSQGLLGVARMNTLIARQGEAYRANMTPPESVMDPRWDAYKRVQDQAAQFDLVASLPGPGEALAAGKALASMGQGLSAAIVAPSVARHLLTRRSLPTDETFTAAVANTPNASITPDGLTMRVQRNQLPEQALQPSVRGGVFYLPEGAAQQKYYSTGKNGYGGSERISGETLFSNPMFAKGATGGKAPQNAYDSLGGKGAYEQMRREALDVNWGRRSGGGTDIETFLEKYAPELSGQGQYILSNSKQGNQLAYALQEAAVGSAVRRAGHDAVLGYGVSRNTKQPFISEAFDVREMNYPDKFGTPTDIWDAFKK